MEIYLLKTDKEDLNKEDLSSEKTSEVRRVTFGQKDPETKNRTIILVGETGTGKSTLINMMINYMLGVKWEDKVRFEIIRDEGDKPQTESQTTAVTAYEIFGLEGLTVPFSLTVIDTPGYGDSRGPEQDKKFAQNLYKLLKSVSGAQQITAACVVVKSSANRLGPSQKYIFDAILSLFGKDMEKNILTLITFSNWLEPTNALEAVKTSGVPFRHDENGQPVYFLFDNGPFQKPEKRFEAKSKSNWNDGMKSLAEFFQALDGTEAQSSKMIVKHLKKRKRLETNIQSLEGRIEDAQRKHAAHEKRKKFVEDYKKDMMNKKPFEYKYTTVEMEEWGTDKEATRCPGCKFNCHYPGCWWTENLKFCSVMSKGQCTACPKKCHYKVHKKEKKIYVAVEKSKTKTLEELKRETEKLVATAEEVMSDLEKELTKAEAEMIHLIEQCYQSVLQLEEHALKFHSESTRKTLLRLIGNLKKIKDTEKVRELERMLESTV